MQYRFIHSPRGFWMTIIGQWALIGLVMLGVFTARRYLDAPLPKRVVRRRIEPSTPQDLKPAE